MNTLARFSLGLGFLREGWRTLRTQPRILIWAVIPLAIDLALLVAGWVYGLSLIPALVGGAISSWVAPDSWLYLILYYPLLFILGVGMILVWLYVVIVLATILSAPFLAVVAERTLAHNGFRAPPQGLVMRSKGTLRMFGVGLIKGLLLLVVAVILLALSFIPIVNLAAGFLGLMILAYDSVDYSLEAKGLGLKERWQFACARRVELAGMALALSLTLLIPGLTVLLQPIGVAGAVRGARVLERESAEKSA